MSQDFATALPFNAEFHSLPLKHEGLTNRHDFFIGITLIVYAVVIVLSCYVTNVYFPVHRVPGDTDRFIVFIHDERKSKSKPRPKPKPKDEIKSKPKDETKSKSKSKSKSKLPTKSPSKGPFPDATIKPDEETMRNFILGRTVSLTGNSNPSIPTNKSKSLKNQKAEAVKMVTFADLKPMNIEGAEKDFSPRRPKVVISKSTPPIKSDKTACVLMKMSEEKAEESKRKTTKSMRIKTTKSSKVSATATATITTTTITTNATIVPAVTRIKSKALKFMVKSDKFDIEKAKSIKTDKPV